MKIIKTLFILFALCCVFATCKKEDNPVTENLYFKCKLNGQDYIPSNCANCLQCEILHDTTFILGGNTGFQTLGIGINDGQGIKVISYTLNEVIGRRGDYKSSTIANDRYFTDASHVGLLTISSLDKTKKIITGTFSFTAYNAIQNNTVNITEGSFRLKYTDY